MDNDYIIKLSNALILLRLKQVQDCLYMNDSFRLDREIDELIKSIDAESSAPFDLVACFAEFTGETPAEPGSWLYDRLKNQ